MGCGRLQGEVALITGSSRNIGKATAFAFAREGANLILNTRVERAELDAAVKECRALGADVIAELGDVSIPEDVNRIANAGIKHFGKIDILVSCVGVRPQKMLVDMTDEDWRHTMAVNLDALFYLSRAVLPGMVERRHGSIIALGGASTYRGLPFRPAVQASKAGLHGLIKAIGVDYGPYGVRANLVSPGLTNTERRHPEWYLEWDAKTIGTNENELKQTPLRRLGKVEDIASAILFLASDESAFITCQQIVCDGGRYI